jgi:hypothetical protein
MSRMKWLGVVALGLALGLAIGCDSDDDDNNGGGDGTSYAGVWTGNVCGRGLTMNIRQSGNTLSGTYSFTNPDFADTFSGTVSGTTPPATATLRSTGGHDYWFEVTFTSASTFTGGYYKSGVRVCGVNARK